MRFSDTDNRQFNRRVQNTIGFTGRTTGRSFRGYVVRFEYIGGLFIRFNHPFVRFDDARRPRSAEEPRGRDDGARDV